MIEIQKVKDDVALNNGFNKWQGVIQYLRGGLISYQELDKLENEVISEVAKQVAERQKEICYNSAKIEVIAKEPDTQNFWNFGNNRWLVPDKESILNAPIPEIV